MSLYIKVKKTDGSTLIAQSTTIAPTSWSYDPDLQCDTDDNANSIIIPLNDDATPDYLKLTIPAAHQHNTDCMAGASPVGCAEADEQSTVFWNKAVGEVIADALERDDKTAHISVMSTQCTCVGGAGSKECSAEVAAGDDVNENYYNHIFDNVSIGPVA